LRLPQHRARSALARLLPLGLIRERRDRHEEAVGRRIERSLAVRVEEDADGLTLAAGASGCERPLQSDYREANSILVASIAYDV
jgi:hypothetical protein